MYIDKSLFRVRLKTEGDSLLSPGDVLYRMLITVLLIVIGSATSLSAQENKVGQIFREDLILTRPGERLPEDKLKKARHVVFDVSYENPENPNELMDDPLTAQDADIRQIQVATKLEQLAINGSQVTADGLRGLEKLNHLKILEYERMNNADACLKVIARFPSLEKLLLADSDTTNLAAVHFEKMSSLKYLDLSHTKVNSDFFAKHQLPKSLTHLRLDGLDLDASVVDKLPSSITHLSLDGTGICSPVVPKLLRMQHLKVLQVNTGCLSHNDLDRVKAGLPDTRVNEEGFSKF